MAVVAAVPAKHSLRLEGKVAQILGRECAGGKSIPVLQAHQGNAVRSHVAGKARAHHLALKHGLHDAQEGVVQKGSARYKHVRAKILWRAQAQDLVEGIAHNGVAKSCRNVRDTCPFLLGLLDLGVHEHCAAGTKVHGVFGKERCLHKGRHGHPEACGKGLQECAAAGGAGLVEAHVRNCPVLHGKALHVLAANVYDIGAVGFHEAGCLQMRHRLHFRNLGVQGCLCEICAIACCAYAPKVCCFGNAFEKIYEIGDEGL